MKPESKTFGSDAIRKYLLERPGQEVPYQELVNLTGMTLAYVRTFCKQYEDHIPMNGTEDGVVVDKKIKMKHFIRGGMRGRVMTPVYNFQRRKASR